MMDRVILDTDIYSEILKGRNQVVSRRAKEYEDCFGQFTISVVTMAEIVKGIQKRGDIAEIDRFVLACELMELLPLDTDSAVIAGKIYGLLEKRGLSIDRADPLIAGIAIARDLTLSTGNTKHFQRVVDLGFPLRLVNWRDDIVGQ
jgi:tRNA(fMet)-specific endonuclease VapC